MPAHCWFVCFFLLARGVPVVLECKSHNEWVSEWDADSLLRVFVFPCLLTPKVLRADHDCGCLCQCVFFMFHGLDTCQIGIIGLWVCVWVCGCAFSQPCENPLS